MKYIKTVSLEIDKPLLNVIRTKSNDTARYLLFRILDNGVPFVLTGKTVRAYIKNSNPIPIYNDLVTVDATQGMCELKLTSGILKYPGLTSAELEIREGTDVISTLQFVIDIVSTLRDDTAIESTNEFSALTIALDRVEQLDKNLNMASTDLEKKYTARLNGIDAQLEDKATKIEINTEKVRIDNLIRISDNSFYEKCLNEDSGALLIVNDNASTGQINIINVTPTEEGYIAKVGDYVRFVHGISSGSAELVDLRIDQNGEKYNNAGEAVRTQFKRLMPFVKINKNPQLFDRNKIAVGFMNTSGGISSSQDYCYTSKIKVSGHVGETIYFSIDGVAKGIRFLTAFDVVGNVIPFAGINDGTMETKTYLIPSDVEDIIITYYNPEIKPNYSHFQAEYGVITNYSVYGENIEFNFTKIESFVNNVCNKIIKDNQYGNVLYGKKYVACGDSFTEGDFTGYIDSNGLSGKNSPELYDKEMGCYKTYPWYIAKRNNMTLVNEAMCGTTMTNINSNSFSVDRYKNIPKDADYITIWFGINDAGKNCTLGTISDSTNLTFYGSWNIVLDYLAENHPWAKIGIVVTNGSTSEFTNAIRQVSRKWGIPYLDLEQDYQIPLMFRVTEKNDTVSTIRNRKKSQMSVSNVEPYNLHPNLKAHEYQSTFIENWIRSL